MDLALALTRNHTALLRLVAALFAVTGLAVGGAVVEVLPQRLRLKVLRVLRPAEAACRRLVFLEARGLRLSARAARSAPTGKISRSGRSKRVPAFPLFDSRKRFDREAQTKRFVNGGGPRLSMFGGFDDARDAPEDTATSPDDEVSAVRMCRRLLALHAALSDMPKQAKRMARAMARRAQADPGPRRVPPLRPGWPPGYRSRGARPVDVILSDCHHLAVWALNKPPDTS